MRQFILTGAAILVVLGGRASAGTGFGEIAGTVFDAGFHPAPAARITLVHQSDGQERSLVADADGKYKASRLPVGHYTITVGGTELRATLADGQTLDLPIQLTNRDFSFELPLNGRNYLDLVRSLSDSTWGQVGGNIEGYGPYSPRGNTSINAVGQRGQTNNFLLDGLDNNEPWLGTAVLQPSVDAIQSANLDTVDLPSSTGHTAGGRIDVQTRRGSSQLHGSLFEYLQNATPDS